jgi:predicted ATP-binding protein involved in virulence
MINMIGYILKKYNGYAILATHSPIILQEVPSNNVRVFERLGNTPNVRNLEIETFGENISNITKTVFSTDNVRQDYKDVLRKLAAKYSLEEVEGLFEGRLSMNALIFLKGCYRG